MEHLSFLKEVNCSWSMFIAVIEVKKYQRKLTFIWASLPTRDVAITGHELKTLTPLLI